MSVRIVFLITLVFSVNAYSEVNNVEVNHGHFFDMCSDNHIAFDGYCFGYIKGILASMGNKYCMPRNVSLDQIKEAAKSYIYAHPELRHKQTADLVANSIIDNYPCG